MYKVFNLHISKWKLVLLASDLAAYTLAVLMAMALNPKLSQGLGSYLGKNFFSLLLMGTAYPLVIYIADLYDYQLDYRRWINMARLVFAALIGTLMIIVLFYFPKGVFVGRTQLIIQTALFVLLLVLGRWAFTAVALPVRLQRKLLIVGAGSCGRRLLEALRHRPGSGLAAVGFVDDDPRKCGAKVDGLPVLGNSSQLPELLSRHQADLVAVAVTHEKSQALINALSRISWNGCDVLDMPSLYEFLAGKVPIEHISDLWLYLLSMHQNKFYYRRCKRLVDWLLALAGLIITAPLFLLTALAVKLGDRGPVFFRQERLGQDGKPFVMIKFRTMTPDAERHGPQWAGRDDPRVTPVGRWLRKFRLDELPQLINILKGEMSFIGPRPEREAFVQEFQKLVPEFRPGRRAGDPPGAKVCCGYKEKIPFYSFRLTVKPGITGWAQVMYPYASSEEQTWEKLKYDLYYIKNMGFFLDLTILLKTVRIVLFGRGT
ncbi:MAG: sugar transferase [Deltaproteobacteria bacterium]|nr:sugar transferase [Deltaproteobacteria bacterium]